jgi:D-3-phosphoglycerate dehydrogenase
VSIINAGFIARQRHIDAETVIAADQGEDRLAIALETDGGPRVVEGAIYADGVPRVTNLDGYAMDMVPAGPMVLLTNADEPGRIGLVGRILGEAGVNIAEMVIGRKRDQADTAIAMMILKLDETPPTELLEQLQAGPGILTAAAVALPPA